MTVRNTNTSTRSAHTAHTNSRTQCEMLSVPVQQYMLFMYVYRIIKDLIIDYLLFRISQTGTIELNKQLDPSEPQPKGATKTIYK